MKTVWQGFGVRSVVRNPRGAGRTASRSQSGIHAEPLEPRALLAVTVPPSVESTFVEIDDNILVEGGGGTVEGTAGYVQIFGNSRGRIDRATGATDADLLLKAQTSITVTGAIGAVLPIDSLTLQSSGGQPVNLQQAVTLHEDLIVVKAGSFSVGGTVDVGGDVTITDATTVLFAGNVTVDGDLTITNATNVTFAGTLTVGGTLTITNATGTTRFAGDVVVAGAAVTSTTLVQVQAGFTADAGDLETDADVTFTTNQINLISATLQPAAGTDSATLTIRPRDTGLALTVASPPGVPSGLNITDASIFAIQAGWKRVVFGDEVAGTGTVRVGSIGSQYGGFSQILSPTTIAGGAISIVQPVDVTTLAGYLDLIALGDGDGAGGGITIDAPINQTAEERNDWVRLTSVGPIVINAPIWAGQTVSLTTTEGGTIQQGGTAAAITAPSLAVVADGNVTLADAGNAIALVAIKTTNDSVVLREDSGYSIAQITTVDEARDTTQTVAVTGVDAGTGTVRLVTISGDTASAVGQGRPIVAAGLGLEGAGTSWALSLGTNDIGTLAAHTGSVSLQDVDDLTVGTVAAVSPQSALSGITVSGTVAITAATKLTITSDGDIVSQSASGTAVSLAGTAVGIETAGDVTTSGGDAVFNQKVTLAADVTVDVVDGSTTGKATFFSTINGTTSGQESLSIIGDVDARGAIGGTTALESLSVSGDATLAAGGMFRTTGDQTYSGKAESTGAITIQAGSGSTVKFLGNTALGGLVTSTADTAKYSVELTGNVTTIVAAVTFANVGTVTLGNAAGDSLTFDGGVVSTAPAKTLLAGAIGTSNGAATFAAAELTAATTLATGSGNATFTAPLDGGFSLAVNSSGTTTFGDTVGATSSLVSLTTDAGGTTALDGGIVKTSGMQTFSDAVLLGAATTLTASGVEFKAKVEGSQRPLTIVSGAAGVMFGGDVGTAAFPVAAIDVESVGNVVIDGEIHSSGPVTIESSEGAITGGVNNAIRAIGIPSFDDAITLRAATGIGVGTAIAVEAPLGVTANVTTSGGIALRGIGDLVIPADGLSAPGTISLAAGGTISVPTGGTIIGGDVLTTKEVRWSVLNTTDSGVGSLRQVLANVNALGDCNVAGSDAVILLDVVTVANGAGSTVVQLTSQLPDVAAAVTLDGTSAGLVLDGGRAVASGLVYRGAAAGSILRGVTLRNFTGFGVQLVGAQNVLVDTITVQSLPTSMSMGLYASGDLARTKVVGSTFSGGLRGALLDGARNFVFGRLGSGGGNTLSNNRAAPNQPNFAGTGIRAQGECAGTVVEGNIFTNNNYGFAFVGARKLSLRNNSFTRNSIAGIFIEGDSAGSTQSGNTFGTGVNRNKVNVLRSKRSRFG